MLLWIILPTMRTGWKQFVDLYMSSAEKIFSYMAPMSWPPLKATCFCSLMLAFWMKCSLVTSDFSTFFHTRLRDLPWIMIKRNRGTLAVLSFRHRLRTVVKRPRNGSPSCVFLFLFNWTWLMFIYFCDDIVPQNLVWKKPTWCTPRHTSAWDYQVTASEGMRCASRMQSNIVPLFLLFLGHVFTFFFFLFLGS